MELVYLWVEDYKNIHKQGFNFSPRFTCDYNYETNELTIKENDDYIKNFFGENINVTAIVGKNGSGKSSILELISFLRFTRIRKITNKKVILVYNNKNNLYIICDVGEFINDFKCDIEIINKTTYNIIQNDIMDDALFTLTMFTNSLYDFTMQDEDYHILRTLHFNSFYNGNHIHYKERQNDEIRHYELNSKYGYLLKDNNLFFDFLDEKFLFDKMYLEIDLKRKYELLLNDNNKYIEQYKKINDFYNINSWIESSWSSDEIGEVNEKNKRLEVIYKFLSLYFLEKYIYIVERFKYDLNNNFKDYFLEEFLNNISIQIDIKKDEKKEFIAYISIIILTRIYYIKLNKYIKDKYKDKDKQNLLDDFKLNTQLLKYVTKFNLLVNILDNNFILEDFDSYRKKFYLISINTPIDYKLLKKYEKYIEKSILINDLYNSNIIRLNFYKQNKHYNYRKLSTGEKQLLEFLINFAYTIKTMKYTNMSIIFIEEIEISMHPEWQKRLLNIIIKIFEKLNLFNHNSFKYNIIFTTHSPFLLSDIPKQNIIFLDKDENGNCKVVDGLKEKKQTFGANIHTLLSDSFFMEDGLMGEFAKGKINDVYNFIVNHKIDKIKTKEEAQKIINIIGEPIIQKELQKLFDEKFELSTMSLNDEINQLERKLKALKKIKNDKN